MPEVVTYLLNTFIALFVIVDPFAVVPVYLMLTQRFPKEAQRATRRKATFVALGILVTFGITGLSIFNIFGITLPAFQIAGGILLLLIGIAQLNANRSRVKQEEKDEGMAKDDISVFPLGTPLIAGPGAISTVVLLSSQARGGAQHVALIAAIFLALAMNYVILKAAPYLFRVLGQTGLNLITRIMGIILTAVAVQFILNGVKGSLELMR